ncbi:MAG: hypothetical protein J5892_00450 [Bacilli bacterium]|nr:hypothetical protein [Bacilli bacterium]
MKILKNLKYLLVLAIILPVFASAETVAKIGTDEYESLQEAITAATTGAEIILQDDIVLDYSAPDGTTTIYADKNIIINLNDHSYTGYILNNGTVTIKNGTLYNPSNGISFLNNDTVEFSNVNTRTNGDTYTFVFRNNSDASLLTVNGGTYVGTFENNGGTMTINSGTFTEDTKHNMIFTNAGLITVNGGNFIATTTAKNLFQNTTYSYSIGGTSSTTTLRKIVINDGVFNAYQTAFTNLDGTSAIEINGGTINSTSTEKIINSNISISADPGVYGGTAGTVTITGGTINATNSSGIFIYSGNKLIIGKNDGTVTNDSPTINIPNGSLGSGYYNDVLEFYDGTVIQKAKIDGTTGTRFNLTDITIPTGYYIKYDTNADSSITAYLAAEATEPETTEPTTTETPTTPASDVSEETSTTTEDIKNPNTGMFISIIISSSLLLILITSIVILKKRNKLYNI